MKPSKFLLALSGAFLLGSCAMSGPASSSIEEFGVTSENIFATDSAPTGVNEEIFEIYKLYVANGGTLSYEEWLQSIKGEKGDPGRDGSDGKDGRDGKDGKDGKDGRDGQDGLTPYIGSNGNWWIGDMDIGVCATGAGKNGEDGQDGLTPYIGPNGNWWIGNTDTGVNATGDGKNGSDGKDGRDGSDGKDGRDGSDGKDGEDGLTPYVGPNGNWWLGDSDTGIPVTGDTGKSAYEIFMQYNPDYPYGEEQWIYDVSHGRLGEHTLQLDPTGGTLPEGTQTYWSGLHYYTQGSIVLPEVTRDRYRFEGWYDAAIGSRYAAGLNFGLGLERDITLQARWTFVGSNGQTVPIDVPVETFEFDHSLIYYGEDIYTYEEDESHPGGVMVTGFNENYDYQAYISIPSQIGGMNVTMINHRAFFKNVTLAYVAIPETVEEIGVVAFSETYIKEVDLTNASSLKKIDGDAFRRSQICQLDGFDGEHLPMLQTIGDYAFYENYKIAISLISFPELVSIGAYNFAYNEKITKMSIVDCPKLEKVSDYVFMGAGNLTEALVSNCPELTNMGSQTFSYCPKMTKAEISDCPKIEYLYSVFCDCDSLVEIRIANMPLLRSLYWGFATYCEQLTDLYLLGVDQLNYLDNSAFENDYSLYNVYYSGTKEQWQAISGITLEGGNRYLAMAKVHYEYAE